MNVEFFYKKQMPIAVIDNYYSEEELEAIMTEVRFINYNNRITNLPIEIQGAAFTEDSKGNPDYKTNKRGIFMSELYGKYPSFSIMHSLTDKIQVTLKKLYEESEHGFYQAGQQFTENKVNCLLNYYEQRGYYSKHRDECTFTIVVILHEEPKRYTGGDLIIEDDIVIEPVHNRAVIFPGFFDHQVDRIDMEFKDVGKGLGRYSITQFFCLRPVVDYSMFNSPSVVSN